MAFALQLALSSNEFYKLLLESKNDESRFGLTRAPFSEQRDAGVRPKPSLAVTLLRAETTAPTLRGQVR